MLNKIEYLNKDNNTKLLIKGCYQRNYQNEEMKSRDIYNDKLHKLKKTYKIDMKNENEHFLKLKLKRQLEAKPSTREIPSVQQMAMQQQATNIIFN